MKKNLSKLFAMALALIMALALTVPAMAAGTGSITITNATVGENYAGYKIFDATYSGNNVAYTITSGNQFYGAVSTATEVFTLTESSVADTYNVAVVQNADVLAWVKSLNIRDLTPDLEATEATSDTVVWSSVPYGYYYITSSLGTLITVDSNLPNVEVIDKNQEPGTNPSKTAGEEDYEIGETIPFTVTFTATNYDGETAITEYYVTDTMPEGMELIVGSLDVKVDGVALTEAYTGTPAADGFNITIPWQKDGNFLYDSPSTVTVTYKAKLNSLATIDSTGNKNEATINWNGNTGSSIPVEDTVYTYALAIKKVDKQGNGLAGAEFVLKNANGDVVKVSGSNGTYTVDPTVTESATITSPDSGLIIIKGVDGDEYTLTETAAPDGYNLLTDPVEVKPVKTGGTTTTKYYAINDNGEVTEVQEPTSADFTIEANVGATAYVVVNFTGTELPSTGGMGTTIFYTLGGLLAVGAAVFLVTKKRMNGMEE